MPYQPVHYRSSSFGLVSVGVSAGWLKGLLVQTNIGRLGAEVVRASGGGSLSVLPSGSIGGPYAGKERALCAS